MLLQPHWPGHLVNFHSHLNCFKSTAAIALPAPFALLMAYSAVITWYIYQDVPSLLFLCATQCRLGRLLVMRR